jgi:hypothetical protein
MSMGPFGGGQFGGPFGNYVRGPHGPWAGCGCSGCLMIVAGLILVFAGCVRMWGF